MLVNTYDILHSAMQQHYCVVAPNICNETTARAAIEVAEEMHVATILDVCPWHTPDIEFLGMIASSLAKKSNVPVALQLDHTARYEDAIRAIRSGYTSIMLDRSMMSFEDNAAQVKEVVKIAHAVGMTVEAELGHVGMGNEYEKDRNAGLTVPEEATEYAHITGCDALAVAIGTAHGTYQGTPKLDFVRLALLRKAVDLPLVLHGGSGSGDANLKKAAMEGINKINIASDLFAAGEANLPKDKRTAYFAFDKLVDGYKEKYRYFIRLLGKPGSDMK